MITITVNTACIGLTIVSHRPKFHPKATPSAKLRTWRSRSQLPREHTEQAEAMCRSAWTMCCRTDCRSKRHSSRFPPGNTPNLHRPEAPGSEEAVDSTVAQVRAQKRSGGAQLPSTPGQPPTPTPLKCPKAPTLPSLRGGSLSSDDIRRIMLYKVIYRHSLNFPG